MKAEIIAVGSELLLGQIINTNAQIISKHLQEIGIDVYYHTCVGDNRERLGSIFKIAFERSEIIVLTGGLGPTADDLTKETIASCLNLPLEIDNIALKMIKNYFQSRQISMTENNLKQALIPKGAKFIPNHRGTAPGILLNYKGKIVVMLPGPPYEMEPMLNDMVIPHLSKLSNEVIYSKVLRFYGIGEAQLEKNIEDLIVEQSNPTIAPLAKMGEVTIRLTAKANNLAEARKIIYPVEVEIKNRIGKYLYGYDGETIEKIVADYLIKENLSISVAESCTGGLLSHRLTNIPGISNAFDRGIISYSNRAKHEHLYVKDSTLKKYGAVSKETAVEMAEGIRKVSGTDIGISITGIAGPDGGTKEKPVGLVFIAYADDKKTVVKKKLFFGNRITIKERSVNAVLHLIRENLGIKSN